MNEEVSSLKAGINLVPQTTKKPQQVRHALVVAVSVLRGTLLVVCAVAVGVLGYQVYTMSNLNNVTDSITENLEYIRGKAEFTEQFISLQSYANELGQIHGTMQDQSDIFSVLEQITPQVVVLENLVITSKDIKITGSTSTYPSITDYFDQLSKSERFANVQIVSISRPTEDSDGSRINFTLSADLK